MLSRQLFASLTLALLLLSAPAPTVAQKPPPNLGIGEVPGPPRLEPPPPPLPPGPPQRRPPARGKSAEAPKDSGGETFAESIEVRVVNVEVFVTDRSGRPVTGLGQGDFELAEDGRPVAITNFYAQSPGAPAVAVAAPAAAAPAAPAAAAPAVRAAVAPESQRLDLGIFIDNLELTPVARNRVLTAIKGFVASHVLAGDRVLLASFDGAIRIRQAPTRNPKALVAAVDEIAKSSPRGAHASQELRNLLQDAGRGTGFSADLEMYVKQRYDEDRASLQALDSFVGSLAGLPGRKAVLFVSGGMSLRPGQVGLQAVAEAQGQGAVRDLALPGDLEVQPLVNRVIDHANASRVTLYGIGAPEDFDTLAIQVGGERPLSGLQFVARDELNGVMGPAAQFTGGFSAIDLNDPTTVLDRLRGDLETFYSLGFSPAHPTDGKDHKLAVRLKGHPGLTVRTRERYRDRNEAGRLTDRALAALLLGVEDNPLGVKLALERDEPGKKGERVVSLLVAVPADKLVLVPREGARDGKFTIFVGTGDTQGRLSPISRFEVPLHFPEERLKANPGQLAVYRVRLVVRDESQTVAVALHDDVGKSEAVVAATYHPKVDERAANPARP
jgi:VWFA-related protein